MLFGLVLIFLGNFAVTAQQKPPYNGWRLILPASALPKESPKWMSPKQIDELRDYMDVTDFQTPVRAPKMGEARNYPEQPQREALVRSLNQNTSATNLEQYLTTLSGFHNRYYTTYGVESAEWIYDTVSSLITASGRNDVSVERFTHSWPQDSVIARIEGTGVTSDIVIVGAHEDSINHSSANKPQARAPGSDDDGSGSVTILEAFRVLLQSGFQPQRSLEFQWYAAEEVGLLGSQDIARQYAQTGVEVYAMLQHDMDGYAPTQASRAITSFASIYVDQDLARFHAMMIQTYADISLRVIAGMGGSDHVPFYNVGYPTSCTTEAVSYPYIHTAEDSLDKIDYTFMQEFVKVAIGFLVELS